jgi:hypothetical protein
MPAVPLDEEEEYMMNAANWEPVHIPAYVGKDPYKLAAWLRSRESNHCVDN